MDADTIRITLEVFECDRVGSSPPYRGEIYEYARDLNLQNGYAIKGNFDINRSKYLIEPLRALKNRHIREVVICKPVQTGGSLVADISIPFWIEHDAGDVLWLLQDDSFASTYMAARFLPLLKRKESIRPMIEQAGRFGVKKDGLLLEHMSVMMGGLNEGNVQSFSRRYVIVDECWLAGNNGLIRQAKDRATAYPHTCKILLISQAGVSDDDFDLEWKTSTMHEWHWQCPGCNKHQPFEWQAKRDDGTWAGMKWDSNETTRPNGRWHYPSVSETARLECFHCGHAVTDTPENRRRLDDTHRYEQTNAGADQTIAGFHWPAIANADISFGSLVVKYLRAKEQSDDHGYLLPLIEFYQKQLAIAWNLNAVSDYSKISTEAYDVAGDWPEEAYRFLTVDCQKDFKEFWYVVRAWSKAGESRQLARGRCESWDEVSAIQAQWKVRDQHVGIDCGYEQTKVAEECVKHGHVGKVMIAGRERSVWLCWVALKGVRQETFAHTNAVGLQEKRIYSRLDYLNPNIGKASKGYNCPFFAWSNLNVKDILRRHLTGRAAKFVSLPDNESATNQWSYTAQMNSERREKSVDENTGRKISIYRPIGRRPNHFWDCEAMQTAKALIHGVIGAEPDQLTDPQKQGETA